MTSAQKPTINADKVDYYFATTRATASYTESNNFVCKSGYYAYIDEVDTALTGCYATSTVSSAPLSNVSGSPVTTNCTYVNAYKKSANSSYWRCLYCANGHAPSASGQEELNCTGTNGITNCDIGSTFNSGTATCSFCASGYTANSNQSACITETTALANCVMTASGNTSCMACDRDSYFGGAGVCVKTAFLRFMPALLVALLALFQ